jgi:hypothetical protein
MQFGKLWRANQVAQILEESFAARGKMHEQANVGDPAGFGFRTFQYGGLPGVEHLVYVSGWVRFVVVGRAGNLRVFRFGQNATKLLGLGWEL